MAKVKKKKMSKPKRPHLTKVLRSFDKIPENMFGKVNVDISTLPILAKPKKKKITTELDEDIIKEIKDFASAHDVPYSGVINDVLRKVFLKKSS